MTFHFLLNLLNEFIKILVTQSVQTLENVQKFIYDIKRHLKHEIIKNHLTDTTEVALRKISTYRKTPT